MESEETSERGRRLGPRERQFRWLQNIKDKKVEKPK